MRYHEIIQEWSDPQIDQMTKSPEFKAWFGKSIVTDENGRPSPCFHYTDMTFDKFKPFSHFGVAYAARGRFHDSVEEFPGYNVSKFSDDTPGAERNAFWYNNGRPREHQTIPVFLRITKPLEIIDNVTNHLTQELAAWLYKDKKITTDELKTLGLGMVADNPDYALEGGVDGFPKLPRDILIPYFKRAGYDGLTYINSFEWEGSRSWVIVDPSQVRPVFGGNK